MLKAIINQLANFPLQRPQPKPEELGATAAVLVALTGQPENPSVILTRRADHLSNHSGEVAFPGGKWDLADTDLLHTALRETHEEIGLSSNFIKPLATLPVFSPKSREMQVTPFVGLVEGDFSMVPEPAEIDSIFTTPLRHFLKQENYNYFDVLIMGEAFTFPCIDYQQHRIWGFTLRVLVNMLNETLGARVILEDPNEDAIERLRSQKE